MSASRGVIRANDPEEFVAAHARLHSLLESAAGAAGASDRYIVERYIPGAEFAIEGLIVNGGLHILAIFDKPDPLEGPFFEETIYVTPSRAEPGVQNSLVDTAGRAAGALGLTTGPLHAELRYNKDGPWVIELAARPIGGKCGRVLRFGETGERSLEDVVVAHAAGMLDDVPRRESCAAGVMMIPIPSAGVLERVGGVDAARRVPGVDEVLITAHRGQELVPLPEGSRYLGFIFARGETPEMAEEALRRAHGALEIDVRGETATPPHPKGGRVGSSHVSRLIEEGL